MLQKHNVQFVVMRGKTLGLGRAAPSQLNHWKGMGSFWYLSVPCKRASWEDIREEERKQLDLESNAESFRSIGWEVQYCSQHYQVVVEETGLINWNQVGWHDPLCGGRQQLQDWYRRRGKPATISMPTGRQWWGYDWQCIMARQVIQTVQRKPQERSAGWKQCLVNTRWCKENKSSVTRTKGKKHDQTRRY